MLTELIMLGVMCANHSPEEFVVPELLGLRISDITPTMTELFYSATIKQNMQ